jgi:hypothetical protein
VTRRKRELLHTNPGAQAFNISDNSYKLVAGRATVNSGILTQIIEPDIETIAATRVSKLMFLTLTQNLYAVPLFFYIFFGVSVTFCAAYIVRSVCCCPDGFNPGICPKYSENGRSRQNRNGHRYRREAP